MIVAWSLAGAVCALSASIAAADEACEPHWSDAFPDGNVNSLVFELAFLDDGSGPALYVGGHFTIAGGVSVNRIARWDLITGGFSPLGTGMNDQVRAIAVFDNGTGPALYAGGSFTMAGDVEAGYIARWDHATGKWAPVGSGMNGPVMALEVFDDGNWPALYAAGVFTFAGGVEANRIARWDGTEWSALGDGVNAVARTLAIVEGDDENSPALYVGGDFTEAGSIEANRIARWDGKNWSALGDGLNGAVNALAVVHGRNDYGPALYVGGNFGAAGNVGALRIARWDLHNEQWSSLGWGVNASVNALAIGQSDGEPLLYVGGSFWVAWVASDGQMVNHVVRYNPVTGEISSMGEALSGAVHSLAIADHDDGSEHVFAGGDFKIFDWNFGGYLAAWNSQEWGPIGRGLRGASVGFEYAVHDLVMFDDGNGPALYATGGFVLAGSTLTGRVARWDGQSWSGAGGFIWGGYPSYGRSFAVFDDGSGPALYVGGSFTNVDDMPITNIARWDGMSWSAVGGGTNEVIYTLKVFDDGNGPALYAGGSFTQAGGEDANFIARWDGRQWSSVGGGISGGSHNHVLSMEVFDDGSGPALYVGGNFTHADGQPANRLARWDAMTWSEVGGGADYKIWSLRAFDDGSGPALFVGGQFNSVGDLSAEGIARWDGATWSTLGGGLEHSYGNPATRPLVLAMAAFDDGTGPSLFVGGYFDGAEGQKAHSIARWDGKAWHAVDGGLVYDLDSPQAGSPGALAMTVDQATNTLFIGGEFAYAGDKSSENIAAWIGCPPGIPGDLNGDGIVDGLDLLLLLNAWGPCPMFDGGTCPADLNGDGIVDGADLLILLSNWS